MWHSQPVGIRLLPVTGIAYFMASGWGQRWSPLTGAENTDSLFHPLLQCEPYEMLLHHAFDSGSSDTKGSGRREVLLLALEIEAERSSSDTKAVQALEHLALGGDSTHFSSNQLCGTDPSRAK